MDIFLGKRSTRGIRLSAHDAIDEGDTDTLREDLMEAFNDDEIEEIERRVDSGDFFEFVTDILEEWAGDEVGELFDLLQTQLADVGVELRFYSTDNDNDEDDEDDDELDFDVDDSF